MGGLVDQMRLGSGRVVRVEDGEERFHLILVDSLEPWYHPAMFYRKPPLTLAASGDRRSPISLILVGSTCKLYSKPSKSNI